MNQSFNYGGQAVMEGVMMRGSRVCAVAVRKPDGEIFLQAEPLNAAVYRGPISRIPFVRGLTMLWDALGLGTRALMLSADVALGEEAQDVKLSGSPLGWGTLVLGLGLGVGLFMLLPSFLVGLLDPVVHSEVLSNLLEGLVRLLLVVGYIWAVGRIPDIRRVFAYHGAEHKTVNAHEAGAPLTVASVRAFPTAHARCGTAFLLTVVLISVLVFAPLGQPTLLLRVLSRLLLLPVIVGISYEWLRLSARFAHRPWMRALIAPNLALQRLTTREPDDDMLAVAIRSLEAVLEGERAMASG